MAFTIRRTSELPPDEAFRRVADLRRHGAFVPLTTVTMDADSLRVGAIFDARTAIGPLGFVDRMRITDLEEGRLLRIEKIGRILGGWATIEVEPHAAGSSVIWTEELWIPGIRWATSHVGDAMGPALFRKVIDGVLAR